MSDNLPTVDLGTGATAVQVTVGGLTTCALLDDGTVKCWGYNMDGQLGQGHQLTRGDGPGEMGDALPVVDLGTGRTATQVAAGLSAHTCALLDNGTVKCWGLNTFGQLGLGNMIDRGDQLGEMGDNLPPVDLGTGRTATQITLGLDHTCALLDNGTVKCWGRNYRGQLGQGHTLNRGDGPGEMGDNLPPVNLGTGRTATQITAGRDHTCALLDDGTVKCWGYNDFGQLGLGNRAYRGDGLGEMGDALPAVNLGTGRTATRISTGADHTCALLDDDSVKCWGKNERGELGLGDTARRGDEPGEMGNSLPAVQLGAGLAAAHVSTSCVLLDNGTVKCWGRNLEGQLGLGDTANRGDGPGEMGDSLPIVVLDASPTVAVSADEGSVAAGGVIHVHVTVGNPGDQELTGVVVDGGNATGCDTTIPVLAAGAQQVIDCTHTTTGMDLPAFTATATATSTQTPAPVSSNTLNVAVTLSPSVGAIGGTITETGTGDPIPGGLVALLSPADFSLVGYANARADGTYSTIAAPGNYFVYALDPAGVHLPGFAGAPTQVTVTGGATTAVNPALAPAAGGFAGTVTETGTDTPLNNVLVVSLDPTTGQPGPGALTDNTGAYTVEPLPAGNRYGIFVDLAGAHTPEFHNDSPGIDGADPIAVGGATTPGINAQLTPTTPPAGGAVLQGTITDSVSTTPLENVAVIALRAADFSLAGGTLTSPAGTYNLNLDPGAYKLELYSLAGSHLMEWHYDHAFTGIADADTVTLAAATATTVDADLDPATGTATGTVTEDGTGTPLADIWVIAIGPTGSLRAMATTDASGHYTIAGLAVNSYRLRFVDPSGAHAAEFHDNSPNSDTATPRTITGGQTTTTNAALTPI